MKTFATFTICFYISLLGPKSLALGMDASNFHKSEDIDDRRGNTFLAEASATRNAQDLLVRLGAQADAGAFPFACSYFKPLRERLANLGKCLSSRKYLDQLIDNSPAESLPDPNTKINEDPDSCFGSRALAHAAYDREIARIDIERANVESTYQCFLEQVPPIYSDLDGAKSIAADKLNGDCAKARDLTLSALAKLRVGVALVLKPDRAALSKLRNLNLAIDNIKCSTAP
ncbi:MAG: hypothetical protein ACXWQO_03055 [Bdellovibrionota bacterium]